MLTLTLTLIIALIVLPFALRAARFVQSTLDAVDAETSGRRARAAVAAVRRIAPLVLSAVAILSGDDGAVFAAAVFITGPERKVTRRAWLHSVDIRPWYRRLSNVFATATTEQIERGRGWYRSACSLAHSLGDRIHQVDVETRMTALLAFLADLESRGGDAAKLARRCRRIVSTTDPQILANVIAGSGIIAATSPNTSWNRNMELIWIVCAVVENGARPAGTMPDALAKALMIAAGYHPETVLGGDKVRSFYSNILDPTGPDVTIDRHAARTLLGEHVGPDDAADIVGKAGVYAAMRGVFRTVADENGYAPAEFQAVAWNAFRENVLGYAPADPGSDD